MSIITGGLGGTHIITGGFGYWRKKFKELKEKLRKSPRIFICPKCGAIAIYDTATSLGGIYYVKENHRLYWHCVECYELIFVEETEFEGEYYDSV